MTWHCPLRDRRIMCNRPSFSSGKTVTTKYMQCTLQRNWQAWKMVYIMMLRSVHIMYVHIHTYIQQWWYLLGASYTHSIFSRMRQVSWLHSQQTFWGGWLGSKTLNEERITFGRDCRPQMSGSSRVPGKCWRKTCNSPHHWSECK